MNGKRQTIWLVSMLSLMVVLSAYYLFTEDVGDVDLTTDELQGSEIQVDAIHDQNSGTAADAGTSDEAGTAKGAASKDASKSEDSQNAGQQKSDEEVLKQLETQQQVKSGDDYFADLQMKRDQELSKLTEKWLTISTDPNKSTDEVTQSLEELRKLEDEQAKVDDLENMLSKNYRNAVVLKEDSRWKVIVQADKLEKSEGVTIVDMVMEQLNVGPDKVTVQYVR